MPKAVFLSEFQEGEHDRRAPRKRYKDQWKRQLAQVGISYQSCQQEASDRDSWHSSVRNVSCELEPQRKNAGGRKSERHPYHPHPKPHQESECTVTNERTRIDHQPSPQKSSSARSEPSSLIKVSPGKRTLRLVT